MKEVSDQPVLLWLLLENISALVLDGYKKLFGPGIYETFGDMDLYAEYMTGFPEDLDLYKNIFVCLGLHFTNYEMSQEEGQLLKDYLLNGRNIWMEGRLAERGSSNTRTRYVQYRS
ncbi:MAG: hypothetical protein R2764_21220 [Bacteroidales bacterium]